MSSLTCLKVKIEVQILKHQIDIVYAIPSHGNVPYTIDGCFDRDGNGSSCMGSTRQNSTGEAHKPTRWVFCFRLSLQDLDLSADLIVITLSRNQW